jgi:hypothetical protein
MSIFLSTDTSSSSALSLLLVVGADSRHRGRKRDRACLGLPREKSSTPRRGIEVHGGAHQDLVPVGSGNVNNDFLESTPLLDAFCLTFCG